MYFIYNQIVVTDLAQIVSLNSSLHDRVMAWKYFVAGIISVLGMEHWWVSFTKTSSAELFSIERSLSNVLHSRVSNDLDFFKLICRPRNSRCMYYLVPMYIYI